MKLSRQYRIGAIVIGLFGSIAVLPLLFWITGTEPSSTQELIESVPTDERGAYLVLSEGVLPLFTWNLQMLNPPDSTPVVVAGSIQSLIVVQKQFGTAQEYQLVRLGSWDLVAWQTVTQQEGQLTLVPAALTPGDYLFIVQTDGMFGGKTYHYFRAQ